MYRAVQRPRGRTIDDNALPFTLKSPTKALALREQKKLEHSRSSGDLRSASNAVEEGGAISKDKAVHTTPARPARARRRSTLDWFGASPIARQKKLEDAVNHTADAFFSLHVFDHDEPIYISEVAEKAMNPNFRFFDLDSCGTEVSRMDSLTVKIWTRAEAQDEFRYFLELNLNLRSLQFIGKSLENFHSPLPSNCVILFLTDGVYTSFMDMPAAGRLQSTLTARALAGNTQSTSSYDSLMRLATLDECIQDALATREGLTSDINAILEKNHEDVQLMNRAPEAKERVKIVEAAVVSQRKRLESAARRQNELRANIVSRRLAIKKGSEAQIEVESNMEGAKEKLAERREILRQAEEKITGQRRRICEDLLYIYPIEPVPNESLGFTIRGIHLPNSEFEEVDDDTVAAALGYVAHVVHQVALYLFVPLPYPITPQNSTSVINDPVSMTNGPRTYPLFLKKAVRYRFEYAVFLLNKDIEILANSLGLRLLDIRHTLPNLKYLLFVATAGKGEVPARKTGGIKGLLRQGRGSGAPKRDLQNHVEGSKISNRRSPASPLKTVKREVKQTNGKALAA